AASLLGYRLLAILLLVANCLAYSLLWLLTLMRLIWFPKSLVNDMISHARGPGFFTLVAGTCILGSEFQLLLGWSGVAAAFWWLGVVLWSVIMYLFFI